MTTLRSMLRAGRRIGLARHAAAIGEAYHGIASVPAAAARGLASSAAGPAAVRSARSRVASFEAFARSGAASSRAFSAEGEKKDDAEEEADEGEGAGESDEETEKLRAELGERDAQVKDLNDKLLRTLADMENLRERTRRQAEAAEKFAIQGFCKDLLDVADNLGRAVSTVEVGEDADAAKTAATLKSLHEGVLMVEKQLASTFASTAWRSTTPRESPSTRTTTWRCSTCRWRKAGGGDRRRGHQGGVQVARPRHQGGGGWRVSGVTFFYKRSPI